jgi:2Fe-2S ferredoxin
MHKVTSVADERTVEAEHDEPIEQVCDRELLGVPFGCKNAQCGTCVIRIKKGKENLNAMGEQEREVLEMLGSVDDCRLACQCKVKGDIEFDEP